MARIERWKMTMIKKTHYIRVKTLPEIKTEKVEKKNTKAEEQDKIARLYALAQKLGVKIGG